MSKSKRKKYWEGIQLNERGSGYLVEVDDAIFTLMQHGYKETKRGWIKKYTDLKRFHAYVISEDLIDVHIDKVTAGHHSAIIKPELVNEVRRIRGIVLK